MLKWIVTTLTAAAAAAALWLAAGCGGDGTSIVTPTDGEFLFVQTATGGTFQQVVAGGLGRYTLTLTGVFPNTQYFSDRPERIAGQTPMADFLRGLGFARNNPPNAAVVVPNGDADDEVIVAELYAPIYDALAGTLTYQIKVLPQANGTLAIYNSVLKDRLPATFTNANLFIDDCAHYKPTCDSALPGVPAQTCADTSFDYKMCWKWKKLYCEPCDGGSVTDLYTSVGAWCEQNYGNTQCCQSGNGCFASAYSEL